MPEELKIGLSLPKPESIKKAFEKAATAVDSLADKYDRLHESATKANGAMGASGGAGAASNRRGVAARALPPTSAMTDIQRLRLMGARGMLGTDDAQRNLRSLASHAGSWALRSGDPKDYRDAMQLHALAKKYAPDPKPGKPDKGMWDKFKEAAYSSRFGADGGMMPLLGKSLDIIGAGKLAGPVAVAAAAVELFTKALEEGRQKIKEEQAAKVSGGARSHEEIEMVRKAAIRGGVSEDTVLGWAKTIEDKSKSGADTLNTLGKLHIRTAPGKLRDTDRIKLLDRYFKAMDKLTPEQQVRVMQDLGLEGQAAYFDKSQENRGRQMVDRYLSDIKHNFGVVGKGIYGLIGGTTEAEKKKLREMEKTGHWERSGGMFPRMQWITDEKKEKATERNTQAIEALTKEMHGVIEIAGGGVRASSMPKAALHTTHSEQMAAWQYAARNGLT